MEKNNEKSSVIFFIISASLTLCILMSAYVLIAFNSLFLSDKTNTGNISDISQDINSSFEDINPDPYLTQYKSKYNNITSPIISEDDPAQGAKQSKVTIVQYSDFTCKFCFAQEQVIKKLVEKYKNSLKFIRKDYPSSDEDTYSWKSSVAARCAGEQGKYWNYSDMLYANDSKNNNIFIEIAENLKLELSAFKSCLVDNNIKTLIKNNILEADALNIKGVPYIFIDDIDFMGNVSEEELEQIIKKKIE